MFNWDVNKALLNREKHRVSFEEGATVFGDSEGLDWEDLSHSQAERQYKRLGKSAMGRVLLVVYTVRRLAHEKETIRIISARQASRKERQAYAR